MNQPAFARFVIPSEATIRRGCGIPSSLTVMLPPDRAMLCPMEWTQLNYRWWTMLEPYLTNSYKQKTAAIRQQARKDLEDQNNALVGKLRPIRGQ